VTYDKVLVVGPHSSIASFVLPEMQFNRDQVYALTRRLRNADLQWVDEGQLFVTNYPIEPELIKRVVQEMCPFGNESVLVLNFAGFFGEPATIRDFDLNSVIDVLTKNTFQFLSLVKLFECFPSNSLMIGFSGGGVGGDNMDASSLGYLMSKISLAGIVEVIDREFLLDKKRLALIAPGAFPSEMQAVVANSAVGVVSEDSRNQAANVQADKTKILKLANAITWVANNPNEAGGRVWSAQRDDFFQNSRVEHFGLLRRVID